MNLTKCQKCGQPIKPHQACKNCGVYQGREVIDVLKKLNKREQKKRKKELEAQEAEAQHEHDHKHEVK
jgi:large subunit ribosomal protein L32